MMSSPKLGPLLIPELTKSGLTGKRVVTLDRTFVLFPAARLRYKFLWNQGEVFYGKRRNRGDRIGTAFGSDRRHQFRVDGPAPYGAGRESLFQVRGWRQPG